MTWFRHHKEFKAQSNPPQFSKVQDDYGIRFSDLLLLDLKLPDFFFLLLAVALSPLAPGPSFPGPAAPRHPAPDLNLLDLQLLDHGFPAPWSPNPGPQLLPLWLEEVQDNIQVKALAGQAKSSTGNLRIEKCNNCRYNFPLLEVRTHSRITFQWNQCAKAFT